MLVGECWLPAGGSGGPAHRCQSNKENWSQMSPVNAVYRFPKFLSSGRDKTRLKILRITVYWLLVPTGDIAAGLLTAGKWFYISQFHFSFQSLFINLDARRRNLVL